MHKNNHNIIAIEQGMPNITKYILTDLHT